MEWNREKTLVLIEEFHQRPGLWNMTHEDYRKKEVKRKLLGEIAAKFDNQISVSDVEKKFHTLRTQYHREIHRMKSESGPESYKSKWFAFNQLQFLNDPSACRSNRETGRRNSIAQKVMYLTNVNVDEASVQIPVSICTPTATIHNVQVVTSKEPTTTNSSSIRKDLRVLFEETMESEEDKNEDEQQPDPTNVSAGTIFDNEMSEHHNKMPATINNCSYEEEHLVEDQVEALGVVETAQKYQMEPSLKYPKIEARSASSGTNQDYYSDMVYEPTTRPQHSMTVVEKVHKDAATVTPQYDSTRDRDQFSTFGEYVANELRFITDRQILISCKHKINTALFEASLAQVQQDGKS